MANEKFAVWAKVDLIFSGISRDWKARLLKKGLLLYLPPFLNLFGKDFLLCSEVPKSKAKCQNYMTKLERKYTIFWDKTCCKTLKKTYLLTLFWFDRNNKGNS